MARGRGYAGRGRGGRGGRGTSNVLGSHGSSSTAPAPAGVWNPNSAGAAIHHHYPAAFQGFNGWGPARPASFSWSYPTEPYQIPPHAFNMITEDGHGIPEFVGKGRLNPEYRDKILHELNFLRDDRWKIYANSDIFRKRIESLPYGYSMQFDLSGVSIRELRDMIRYAGLLPHEYAVSGWGYACVVGQNDVFSARRTEFRHVCLVEVDFPEAPETFEMDGSDYLEWVRDFRKYVAGSDLSTWIIFGPVRLARMNTYPTFAQLRYRTAGFDRLIPSSVEFSVVWRNREYLIFIPGGQENCFHSAIKWADKYHTFSNTPNIFSKPVDERMRIMKVISEEVEDALSSNFEAFRISYVEERLAKNRGRVRAHGLDKTKRMIDAEFDKITKNGYSSVMLKRLRLMLLREVNLIVRVASLDSTGKVQKNGWFEELENSTEHSMITQSPPANIALVKILQDGSICRTGAAATTEQPQEQPDPSSMLSHAIAIHPYPPYAKELLSEFLTTVIEPAVQQKFTMFKERASESSYTLAHAEQVKEWIKCQNERLSEFQQQQEQPQKSSSSGSNSKPNGYHFYPNPTYVIAFDIETVENLRGAQDVVYPPFSLLPPSGIPPCVDVNDYTVPLTQIPYTVQWAFVDFRETAEMPYIENNVGVRIEYGDNQLGKCVTDFMDNVREVALLRTNGQGSCRIFAYAHNASGFDSYIVKCYNHKYKVKKVLNTPRGILSISFDLGYNITLTLRDTKVFFAATLRDLCTIFHVPAQYTKTDFPITLIHARNFKDTAVQQAVREYMENDVYSLAIVVRSISGVIEKLIKSGSFVPDTTPTIPPEGSSATIFPEAPAITKYVTLMSLVKFLEARYFTRVIRKPFPPPVDLSVLRKWISYGNVGGRVVPFWRGYASGRLAALLAAYRRGGAAAAAELRAAHSELLAAGACMRVYDVTSLYPYVMSAYPMPCVANAPLHWISPSECEDMIRAVACTDCMNGWSLCEYHRGRASETAYPETCLESKGFAFIMVAGLAPPADPWDYVSGNDPLTPPINICPRKYIGGGLVYSFETDEAIAQQAKGSSVGKLPEIQTYTHYDLMWLRMCGFTFQCVGGILFETSYEGFQRYTDELFAMRVEAKQVEREQGLPKALSTFGKLIINGRYGVKAQRDITTSTIVVDSEDEGYLRSKGYVKPDEVICRNIAYSHKMANGQWMLKVEKSPYSCEYYAGQSPNHIGAAIVATARHHVNLAMYRMLALGGMCSYTDTDSMCVYLSYVKDNMPAGAYDESPDAAMGTYKNDHERGKEEIVIASLIARKKVKLHVTLDAEGEIRFYPTFTGYNPSAKDEFTGADVPGYLIEKRRVQALSDIFFDGEMKTQTQTEFRRALGDGITIDRNAKISGDFASFWGHSDGGILWKFKDESGDFCEKLVPLGCGSPSQEALDNFDAQYVSYKSVHQHQEEGGCTFLPETRVKRSAFWGSAFLGREEEYVGEGKKAWDDFLEFYYTKIDEAEKEKRAAQMSENEKIAAEGLLELLRIHSPQLTEEDTVWQQ